jgi:hypothetical protein
MSSTTQLLRPRLLLLRRTNGGRIDTLIPISAVPLHSLSVPLDRGSGAALVSLL